MQITNCDIYRLVVDGKKDIGPSQRQDYSFFVRFDSIGSKDVFLRDGSSKTMKSKYKISNILCVVWKFLRKIRGHEVGREKWYRAYGGFGGKRVEFDQNTVYACMKFLIKSHVGI